MAELAEKSSNRANHNNSSKLISDSVRRSSQAVKKSYGELKVLLFLIIALLSVGSSGYALIEGWSTFDSLYMTVITLAGVGFQEVHPLSNLGRAFTIVIIMLGFGVVAVFFSTITQLVVERQLDWVFKGRRIVDVLKKLDRHTIICGFGRIARIAAQELRKASVDLVIIENDPARVEEARSLGYLVVEGDATDDETLIHAGITRAGRLVSLLSKGSDNLYVVLTSRELCPDLYIVSRAEDDKFEKRLQRAGASRLFSPYRLGGQRIADGLIRPYVTNFLDLAASSSKANLSLEEIKIPEETKLAGQTLLGVNLRKKSNVIVAAIISKNGLMSFNPNADTVIEGGSTFIVLGERDELTKLEQLLLG